MAKLIPLQSNFNMGMRQDEPRDSLPRGAVWDSFDFIPWRLGGELVKRGGWLDNFALNEDASSYVWSVLYAPFTGGQARVIVFTDEIVSTVFTEGALYRSDTDIESWNADGIACPPCVTPLFHKELVIIPPADGTYKIQSYNASETIQDLSSTAPQARLACIWNDRVVASAHIGIEWRVEFGPPGSGAAAWASSWVDTSAPTTGLFVLRNSLLVFHYDSTERIMGSVPPGYTNFDMSLKKLFAEIGCIDTRTIVGWNDSCIWADENGIWQTDGASLLDLTKEIGLKNWWRETVTSSSSTSVNYAAGNLGGNYLLCMTDMNGGAVESLLIDPDRRAAVRLGNMTFTAIARTTRSGGPEDACYGGFSNHIGIARLNEILDPDAAGGSADSDGTDIEPYFETGFYRVSTGQSRIKEAYVGYSLDLGSGDEDTVLEISYATEPTAISWTVTGDLPGTTGYSFRRRAVRKSSPGVSFRIEQIGPSDSTIIRALELDATPAEASKQII